MLNIVEFHAWRRKAKFARIMKVTRYREIKAQLSALGPPKPPRPPDSGEPKGERNQRSLESIDGHLAAIAAGQREVIDLLERILDAQFEPEEIALVGNGLE